MTLDEIYEAVVTTAAVIGHDIQPAAAKAMAQDLASYPEEGLTGALVRCRRELSGRLTLAAIIQRIDDGHLGVEEAWALCPRSEAETVVWTDEIAQAYEAAAALLDDDAVAARMAFKESYARLMATARAKRKQAHWWVCLGHDKAGRVPAVRNAVELGRMTAGEALRHVSPELPGYAVLAKLAGVPVEKALPAPERRESGPVIAADDVALLLKQLRG